VLLEKRTSKGTQLLIVSKDKKEFREMVKAKDGNLN
jgi:hypothetical protein